MLKFIKSHSWLLIVIFLLLLFPQSLTDQAKLNMRVIITGIGVDFVDNQYQVTSQLVLPENGAEGGGINARISYITSSGQSLSECVQNTSYKLGKFTELSHVEFVLVGETMKDHNLASSLDYFFRNFKIKKSIMLLTCLGKAKDAIMKTSQLELGVALSVQKIYLSHQRSLSAVATSYVDFISDSNSQSGIGVIDTFMISSDEEQEDGQSSEDEQASSDSGSQDSEGGTNANNTGSSPSSSQNQASTSAQIMLHSPIVIFKNGTYIDKIDDPNGVWGYYFSNKKSHSGNIFLTNFSYGDAQNANINIRIDQMNVHHSVEFSSNKPVHKIQINIKEARIDEIAPQNSNDILLYKFLEQDMQDAILDSAKEKIKQLINTTFTSCQQKNIDIFKTADLCYKFENIKWNKFLQNLENKDEYVKDVSVVVDVKFEQLS